MENGRRCRICKGAVEHMPQLENGKISRRFFCSNLAGMCANSHINNPVDMLVPRKANKNSTLVCLECGRRSLRPATDDGLPEGFKLGSQEFSPS